MASLTVTISGWSASGKPSRKAQRRTPPRRKSCHGPHVLRRSGEKHARAEPMAPSMHGPGTMRITRVLAWCFLLGCVNPILVNRGDFPPPDDPGAPPLPTDYPWGEPRRVDLDHDGRDDLGYYAPDGALVGGAFDENHDGRIDVYKKYGPNGRVIEETRDTNHDGVLDQRRIDTDGDGKLDTVVPYPPR
jgi:hypothetical protein